MEQRRLKIMVLDDEPIVCKRLKPNLEKVGFEVDIFTDSTEALHHVQEHPYDIVISDLKMKVVDGMRFSKK